jgi:HisJ family histidinol phosphate phosphatase
MKFEKKKISEVKPFDTHIHSVAHGEKMREYSKENVFQRIDACVRDGVTGIVLTEHIPLPTLEYDPTPKKDCGLLYENFFRVLVEGKEELKQYAKEKGLLFAIGGEYDFFPNCDMFYEKIEKIFPADVKLLGQHFIDCIEVEPNSEGKDCFGENISHSQTKHFCFDFSPRSFDYAVQQKGIDNILEGYFRSIQTALEQQHYDIVAHIDLINMYNEGEKYFREDEIYKKNIMELLFILKEKEGALEVNLGGTAFTKRLTPRDWILVEANALGIPITIGSDTHGGKIKWPQDAWEFALQELKRIGISSLWVPSF